MKITEPLTGDELSYLMDHPYPNELPPHWQGLITGLRCSDSPACRYTLRALYDDAKAREAAQPKPPPIPPGPQGYDAELWEETVVKLRSLARSKDAGYPPLDPEEAAHILRALQDYRPGDPSVPPEAYVAFHDLGDGEPWQAMLADDVRTWHPTKEAAVEAVKDSWVEWRRNNP